MLGRASARISVNARTRALDALSLSHLTYRFATITVNFHRLDHPPFPCKSRVPESAGAVKSMNWA